jgi:predicted metalloendopeptidase
LSQADPKTPTVLGIYISGEDDADLSKEDHKKPALVTNYSRTIAEQMEIVRSGTPSTASAKIDAKALAAAKKITDLQTKLSKIVPDQEALQEFTVGEYSKSFGSYVNHAQASFEPMTLAQLEKIIPEIDVAKYLQVQAPSGYTVKTVNVYDSKYFKGLSTILKSTDRKTLHDYFEWGLVRAWISGLHKDYTTPLVKFHEKMGVKDNELTGPRWKTCIAEMDEELGWLTSAFFVQRAFSPPAKAKALGERIIGDVNNEYVAKLNAPSFISDAVKTVLLNKCDFL